MVTAESNLALRQRRSSFFLLAALFVLGIVIYAFSRTIRENLLEPAYPRPLILHVHAVVFFCWVLLFIAQTAFVRADQVKLHRRLGAWGLALGAAIPVLGVATAIAMTRLRVAHGELAVAPGILIPLFDMVFFSTAFALAVVWRKRPEYHRRLMFMATAALTAAAFGRFPVLERGDWFYAAVSGFVAIGAFRDVLLTGRIHVVYRIGLPALITGQLLVLYLRWYPEWVALAPSLFK